MRWGSCVCVCVCVTSVSLHPTVTLSTPRSATAAKEFEAVFRQASDASTLAALDEGSSLLLDDGGELYSAAEPAALSPNVGPAAGGAVLDTGASWIYVPNADVAGSTQSLGGSGTDSLRASDIVHVGYDDGDDGDGSVTSPGVASLQREFTSVELSSGSERSAPPASSTSPAHESAAAGVAGVVVPPSAAALPALPDTLLYMRSQAAGTARCVTSWDVLRRGGCVLIDSAVCSVPCMRWLLVTCSDRWAARDCACALSLCVHVCVCP